MRPLTVSSPCWRSSISSAEGMRDLQDRAGSAQRTRRPAPRHEISGQVDEPATCSRVTRKRAVAAAAPASTSSSVNSSSATSTMRSFRSSHATASFPTVHSGHDRPDEIEQRGHHRLVDRRQVGEQPAEVLRERAHLLFLELQRDDETIALHLHVEHAMAGFADRAGGEHRRRVDVEAGLVSDVMRAPAWSGRGPSSSRTGRSDHHSYRGSRSPSTATRRCAGTGRGAFPWRARPPP